MSALHLFGYFELLQSSVSAFISASIFRRGGAGTLRQGPPYLGLSSSPPLQLIDFCCQGTDQLLRIKHLPSSALLKIILCLEHAPVGGSSGSWQGAGTSSSRVISPLVLAGADR